MGILNLDKNRKTIVGVGSALVDLLAFEPDAFIESLGVEKGGMQLVDSGGIDALISKTATPPVTTRPSAWAGWAGRPGSWASWAGTISGSCLSPV